MFEVTRAAKNLGSWSPWERKIRIARRIFRIPKDGQLLNTLAHEMAHQYVSEVLHTTGEDVHGPAWQSTMMSIGLPIDAKFTGDRRELMSRRELDTTKHIETVKQNSDKLVFGDRRITGPTVMRYLVPLKHIDEPVVILPDWSVSRIGDSVLGHKLKNGRFIESLRFSVDVLVFPGPLKIRTPAYKLAQDYAKSLI